MNYYLKAWLSAATLPVWVASACWFDAMKLASDTARARSDTPHDGA